MSSNPSLPSLPRQPTLDATAVPVGSSQSLWDKITSWASEHKAVVYTVAGITLVATAAGVFYFVNNAPKGEAGADDSATATKRKAKKDRRKTKKDSEGKADEESISRRQLAALLNCNR
jgi:mitochondrial import receptor subunit TOM70